MIDSTSQSTNTEKHATVITNLYSQEILMLNNKLKPALFVLLLALVQFAVFSVSSSALISVLTTALLLLIYL